MSGARITIDGLWRCLCPSVDAATLARTISTPYSSSSSRRPNHRPHPHKPTTTKCAARDRLFHTTTAPRRESSLVGTYHHRPTTTKHTTRTTTTTTNTTTPSPANFASAASTPVYKDSVDRILNLSPPWEIPSDATTEDVIEAIRFTRNLQRPRWKYLTTKLVQHLLLAKGVQPNTFIYETLLMAHAATDGSAEIVRNLLKEMRDKKIAWSSTAYHAALRALVVHPDYLVRADVLREMKERWIEVTPIGHQHVALGLLRDEQYELALEKLEEMTAQNQPIEPWVFDIFIYAFGKLEFLDEALRIARHRLDTGHEVSVNIWHFLLDVCSKGQNHEATTYIWHRTVPQGVLNPSDGVCIHILNMAASHGDADLATHILQFLVTRGIKLGQIHYEAVADAYCAQGNVEKAIEALSIMHAARVETSSASMGSLSDLLHRHPEEIDTAIAALETLREKGHAIPVIVFNAILNQLVKHDIPSPKEAYAKALGFYHRVREFVPEGPNWETFRHLLWRCTDPGIAQMLVREMVWFGIRQNQTIMELVLRVHVEYGGSTSKAKGYFYKLAPRYHADMDVTKQTLYSWKRKNFIDISVKLIRRLIGERDPEAWRILTFCQSNGLDEETVRALQEEVESGKIAIEEEDEGEGKDSEQGDDSWQLNMKEDGDRRADAGAER